MYTCKKKGLLLTAKLITRLNTCAVVLDVLTLSLMILLQVPLQAHDLLVADRALGAGLPTLVDTSNVQPAWCMVWYGMVWYGIQHGMMW